MGCYHIDGVSGPVFNGKIALEHYAQGRAVHYDFFDDLFRKINPKIEPKQNLLDMYVRRVRQLRAKYDYLVLYYSGGADSHNILKCFEHSGTRLDEIVSFEDSSYNGKDSHISSEIYGVAIPEVKRFKQSSPETEFRLLNIRDVQKQILADPNLEFDPYYSMTYHIVPFGVMHAFGAYTIKKYHDLHNAGKRVAIIHGVEKPRLQVINDKWTFNFSDWSSHFGHKHYYKEFPFYDEFFYQTPDDPWITIKQSHVIAKELDRIDSNNIDTNWRLNHNANILTTKKGRRVNWELINHVMYPFWNMHTYSSGKQAESYFSSTRDPSLTRFEDELLVDYKKGVEKSIQLANSRPLTLGTLQGTGDTKVIGIKPFYSSPFFIE
jgi:hypothetical protein